MLTANTLLCVDANLIILLLLKEQSLLEGVFLPGMLTGGVMTIGRIISLGIYMPRQRGY